MARHDHASPDDLTRLRGYQDTLAAFSRLASESRDTPYLLHLACVHAARGSHVEHTKVLRYRPEKGDLLMVAGIGWKEGLIGTCTFGIHMASPPGRALQTRMPIAVDDLPNSEFITSPVLRTHSIKALLNTPIVAGNTVWGILEIDSARPRSFDADDATFVTTIANILGSAIPRNRRAEEAEDRARQAEAKLSNLWTLIGEMQHRVKNNFMVITSALSIERQRSASEEAKAALDTVSGRVVAIAMAHDQLGLRDAEGRVDLAAYLQALASNIRHQHEWLRIETDLEALEVPIDRATPLGLIANELMTNAIKHAFPDRSGTIRLTLWADRHLGEAWMTVEDDGTGMGPPRPGGRGTQLISALARQIGGDVTCGDAEVGTRVRVRFMLGG